MSKTCGVAARSVALRAIQPGSLEMSCKTGPDRKRYQWRTWAIHPGSVLRDSMCMEGGRR